MARRFVLDDRRPTSVVSQGMDWIIKTDLTMTERGDSVHHGASSKKSTYLILRKSRGRGEGWNSKSTMERFVADVYCTVISDYGCYSSHNHGIEEKGSAQIQTRCLTWVEADRHI